MEISTSWHGYPKIYALGHAEVMELFSDPVLVEEKVDGSQFSFGRFYGKLKVRSRNKEMDPENPEKLFKRAVEAISALDLMDGWTYRGECLDKPKHNALAYDRVPEKHVILFDINNGHEQYLNRAEKEEEAKRLGLEVVPVILDGMVENVEDVVALLDRVSILGGQKIEGMVFKNYSRFGRDKKALMGKYVSEGFKEVHKKEWGESNPAQKDIIFRLGEMYRNESRWQKSLIHLTEDGTLTNTPKDIGALMKWVHKDIEDECVEEIKNFLYKWAANHVKRGATRGMAEWYKKKLMESQFAAQ